MHSPRWNAPLCPHMWRPHTQSTRVQVGHWGLIRVIDCSSVCIHSAHACICVGWRALANVTFSARPASRVSARRHRVRPRVVHHQKLSSSRAHPAWLKEDRIVSCGTGDLYSAYNKPAAVLDWLNKTVVAEEYVLVIDADMIMRQRITPEVGQPPPLYPPGLLFFFVSATCFCVCNCYLAGDGHPQTCHIHIHTYPPPARHPCVLPCRNRVLRPAGLCLPSLAT